MSEGEAKMRKYLNASAGTANIVSDHTIRCFIGMIETGELDVECVRRVGGDYIVNRINELAIKVNSNVTI